MARLADVTSPLLYSEGVNDAAVEKAVALGKNLLNHIKVHYGLFASQDLPRFQPDGSIDASALTALDLIYYHVYGDYRLVMAPNETDSAPNYLKSPFPTTVLRYKTTTPQPAKIDVNADKDLHFLSEHLATERFDMLHGVLEKQGTTPAMTEWFVKELAFGSSAMKFHLPSLGTMAIANYTYKNIQKGLSEGLAETLEQMMDGVRYNRSKLPPALKSKWDANVEYGADHCPDEELAANPLIFQIAKAITLNPEYIELQSRYPEVPISGTILGFAKNAYKKESLYDAAKYFCEQLLKQTSAVFVPGVPVTFKAGAPATKVIDANWANYPEYIDGNMSEADTRARLLSDTYIVLAANRIGGKNVYDIRTETEFGEEFVMNAVPENTLQLTIADLEDEQIVEEARKAGKKGPKKYTNPALLVFHRVVLDVIFSIEALIYCCAVPTKFFLVSPTVNVVTKQKQVVNYYPNMAKHITGQTYADNVLNNAQPMLEHLATLRTQHAIANIANSDNLIMDSRTMEEFYRQDLRMAEVNWLASALTEEGKVIYEKKEIPNLLAQMQYRAKGIDDELFGEAPVKPQTVFYQIDSPILKDVIMKYDELFINFTVQNAFMPKPKKKKKDKGGGGKKEDKDGVNLAQLASAVWGSIERRTSEIVNRPGVKPHLLFDNLFKQLERLSLGSMYIRDNFPAKWIGTNTVTLLRSAPEVLGEKLDLQFYSDCMDEYIRHLKLVYKSQPTVAVAILKSVTETLVDSETDMEALRSSFLARVKSQANRPQLRGTDSMFDAYRSVISVMRSEIDIPLKFREEYVARKLDEEQKKQIKDTFTSGGSQVVLPEDHPEFKTKEIEVDEESALYGLPNPFDMPVPPYYPRPGETLNTANPKVMRYIESLVGNPTDPMWPPNGFQVSVGIGGLSTAESLALKTRILNPVTTFTVRPIQWRGSEQIWDGRERRDNRAHPSVVAHFRETLGIEFDVDTPSYPSMRLEVVPSSNLVDYSSMLYSKYLTDKYDAANYVYIPAGGVFKNPGVLKKTDGEMAYTPPEDGSLSEDLFTSSPHDATFVEIVSPFEALSTKGTMIYKGDIASLKKAGYPIPTVSLPPPTEVGEPERYAVSGARDENEFVADTIFHESMSARDQLPAIQRWQVTESLGDMNQHLGNLTTGTANIANSINNFDSTVGLLSQRVDQASDSFESAAQSFERASENFGAAAQAYERATEELAKIPEALKEGLSQTLDRLIVETPPAYFDNPETLSDEEREEAEEEIEEAFESSPVEIIREYAELLFKDLPGLMTSSRYNYKKFELLKPLVAENQDVDLIAAPIESTSKTKKQALNWVRNSFVTALTYYVKDEKADPSMMDPEKQKDYYWRQRCMVSMEKAKNGDMTFLGDLGITAD